MQTTAIVGAGLIGQGWAIVFARAGWQVRLYDLDAAKAADAHALILRQLRTLAQYGLVDHPEDVAARVTVCASLEAAVTGADYIQENSPENVEIKQAVFARLDALADAHAILASSTSSIRASLFSESLPGRERCLVAHPVNPPYLIPVVEISGAPWTSAAVIARARGIMEQIGQKPVVVRKEIEGFLLNRLQGALLQEAFRLASAGIASVEDIDTTVKEGLGLRWSFMGPFETIDLNAPGGIEDYCARYGGMYASIGGGQNACVPWEGGLVRDLSRQRRDVLPTYDLPERRFWRDEKLMQLLRHKQTSGETNGQ